MNENVNFRVMRKTRKGASRTVKDEIDCTVNYNSTLRDATLVIELTASCKWRNAQGAFHNTSIYLKVLQMMTSSIKQFLITSVMADRWCVSRQEVNLY